MDRWIGHMQIILGAVGLVLIGLAVVASFDVMAISASPSAAQSSASDINSTLPFAVWALIASVALIWGGVRLRSVRGVS